LLKESISEEITWTDSEGVSGSDDSVERCAKLARGRLVSGSEVKERSKE
jgi:hypothetical protein